MNIGTAIAELARERGVSAAAIHRATGISESYLSMLFHAKIDDPQLSKVWKISAVLGMTVDEVVRFSLSDETEE